MRSTIGKIGVTLKCVLNSKGQGLVEFALILAFCATIGVAAREAGFAKAIDAAFERNTPALEEAAIGGGL